MPIDNKLIVNLLKDYKTPEEMYQVEVSPALISSVTNAVIEEVKVWQNRPLDALYPILYLDALQVKVKDQVTVQLISKAMSPRQPFFSIDSA